MSTDPWLRDLIESAGDRLQSTPAYEMLRELEPTARALLREIVSTTDGSVGELVQTNESFHRFRVFGPRAARRTVERAMLVWARQGVTPAQEIAATLRAYAADNDLQDVLRTPASVLSYEAARRQIWDLAAVPSTLTLDAFLSQRNVRPPALALVEQYLRHRAEARTIEALHAAQQAAPCATPALDALARRLAVTYEASARGFRPYVASDAIDMRIDPEACTLVVRDARGYPEPTAIVSLTATHPTGGVPLDGRSPLAFFAIEIAIEIVHDPEHWLHDELRRAIEAPRWERLLERLRSTIPLADSQPADDHRLVWRVETHGPLVIEPALQKRTQRGWSKGSRVQLHDIGRRKLEPHDERVLAAWTPRPYEQTLDARPRMLEALAGHPLLFVDGEPGRVRLVGSELVVREDEGELAIEVRIGTDVIAAQEVMSRLLGRSHFVSAQSNGEIVLSRIEPGVLAVIEAAAFYATRIPIGAADGLLALLSRLPATVGLELPESIAGEVREPLSHPILRIEILPLGVLRAGVFVRPLGMGPLHRPGEGPTHLVAAEDGKRVHTTRDLTVERHAEEALLAAGLDRATSEAKHEHRFDEVEDALTLLDTIEARPELALVEWPEGSRWRTTSAGRVELGLRRAEHWFEASAKLEVGEDAVGLAALMTAFREERRYVRLGPGRFARLTDELRAQLAALDPVVHVRGQSAQVAPSAAAYLGSALGEIDGDAAWRALRKRLTEGLESNPAIPETLDATLRDYQADGVRWLLRTSQWAEGACLADEMGLGKTVQTLAVLLARASLGPALVVCPTSLADNWRQECMRFAPSLTPVVHRGTERAAKLASIGPGTLLIASYDIVARDREALSQISFGTLVLDEAQAIKNPQAQRTQAVRDLQSQLRIALTGTPIENRLSELYSLFSILAPGLLGSWESFRKRFVLPIERHADRQRLTQLRNLLRPFLLRRTKAQVARELPPRTDVVRPIDLGEQERALYEAERRHALEQLRLQKEKAKKKDAGDVRFALLAALTRLRRLVCHPSLVFENSTAPSSKLEELLSLVEDLRADGHRALVFSQFTSLLAIVRKRLAALGIRYLYLDGSTPAAERATLVAEWQEGDAPIFLISLKAGGTGLNLTAADYVVHLDPWWNPAVEDQASDRAHRIGQDKPVTVVRLVTQGTIEERVLALHEDKRKLASGLLEGAETNATLDTEELLALLDDEPSAPAARKRSMAARGGPDHTTGS